jgi:hypothetical protein
MKADAIVYTNHYVVLPDGKLERVDIQKLEVDDGDFTPLTFPVVSSNLDAQAHYEYMRLNGESHNMAEMLATRSFPGVKTDAVFNEGKFSGQSTGECTAHGKWLRSQAEAAGVSTTGKWYCSGLASFPGDPTAWVDSRGDVLRIAEAKNMNVHGYVEHSAYETDPGDDLDIADDIIEDEVADILEANPFAAVEAVREELHALRTGAVDNNPLLCKDYTSTDIE